MQSAKWGAAFLALALAGCLSGGTPSSNGATASGSEEPISSVVVEPEPGVKVAENRGAVRGAVFNDAGLAVAGAAVRILQTDFLGQTGSKGEFLFVNVTAGVYTLRAEKEGYDANETEVSVRKGNVTLVTIYMLPQIDRGAGYVPHTHDFWAGQTELILKDEDVDLMKDPGSGYGTVPYPILSTVYYPNSNQTNPPGWPIFLPEHAEGNRPAMVLPGTGKLVVTFTWSAPDVNIDKLSIAYGTAADNKVILTPPVPSGTPQTIPVNSSTADTGHQAFTLWRFWVHASNPATGAGYRPGLVTGKMHVKMVLVKADVYLEPEHTAYWATSDMLVLRNGTPPYKVAGSSIPVMFRSNDDTNNNALKLDVGKIVPPGAKKMRLELAWTYPQDAGPANFAHYVVWRVGNQAPRGTPLSAYHSAPPKETVTGPNGKRVYEFDLEPSWTDAFYQKKSNWVFVLGLEGQPTDLNVEPRPHDLAFTVTVWKDPAYGQ